MVDPHAPEWQLCRLCLRTPAVATFDGLRGEDQRARAGAAQPVASEHGAATIKVDPVSMVCCMIRLRSLWFRKSPRIAFARVQRSSRTCTTRHSACLLG